MCTEAGLLPKPHSGAGPAGSESVFPALGFAVQVHDGEDEDAMRFDAVEHTTREMKSSCGESPANSGEDLVARDGLHAS